MTDLAPPAAPKAGQDHARVSKSNPHDEKLPSKGHSDTVKPEKPDEDAYKLSLERARSNLANAQELNVSTPDHPWIREDPRALNTCLQLLHGVSSDLEER